jgi:hypothetical protein
MKYKKKRIEEKKNRNSFSISVPKKDINISLTGIVGIVGIGGK